MSTVREMSVKKVVVIVLVLGMLTVTFSGCAAVEATDNGHTLTASAEKKGEQIMVSGKTNLPDGCVLGVLVERPYWRKGLLVPLDAHEAERMLIQAPDYYWRKGDDTLYTGHMAFGEATVEKGSYGVSLTPDDVGWYDNAVMLIEMGLWTDFERISDDVAISVIFTPKRDQPDSVYAILGGNAENMAGEQVEFSGHFNVLKAEATLNVHFIPPSANILMPVGGGKAIVESVEIAKAIARNWGAVAERYDVADGIATTILIKDQNEEPIDADAELIVELYRRESADPSRSWETAIGELLDRWEITISEKRIVGETGEHNLELEYSVVPQGVEYGILQVTLIRPDGKRLYAVHDMLSLTKVEYTHL